MHEWRRFMTVLEELPFSLLYCLTENKFISERKQKVMKHFLKGAAAVAIVMFILILIHIIFNVMGTDLNKYVNNVMQILLASSFATMIYHVLIRKEQNDDARK